MGFDWTLMGLCRPTFRGPQQHFSLERDVIKRQIEAHIISKVSLIRTE